MAIFLKFDHVDGLRLRQQIAQDVKRHEKETGIVIDAKEWRFDKDPITRKDAELPLDIDQRTQKPLSTYSATINFGLKNLVIEKKGAGVNVSFRNSSVRNQMRIKTQELVEVKKDSKGAPVKEWRDTGTSYLQPSNWGGVYVGDSQRAVVDEMPT